MMVNRCSGRSNAIVVSVCRGEERAEPKGEAFDLPVPPHSLSKFKVLQCVCVVQSVLFVTAGVEV